MLYKVSFSLCFFLLIIPAISSNDVSAQEITYETREVIGGLNVPWEIRWGKDGWIWFTERIGRINRVHPETGEKKCLLVAPTVLQIWESGMLGFDFHPDFPDSPYLYVAFTHQETSPAKLDLFRYTYSNDTLVDRKLILTGMKSNFTHVGCRVLAKGDKLYLTIGEVDQPLLAQDMTSLNGKILRINLDGSIPEDNPFPNSPIWSWGHRNPQGLIFGPTGTLYSSEHGWTTDDELNIIERGRNYGWPYVRGNCDVDTEAVVCDTLDVPRTLHDWYATLGVSGTEFYDHDAIPEWRNSILVAALKDQAICRFKLDESGKQVLHYRKFHTRKPGSNDRIERHRDFCISPEGRLFISTSNTLAPDDELDHIYEFVRTGVIPFSVKTLEPESGASVFSDTANLVWASTAGDSRYEVQLASHKDFVSGSIIYNRVTTDTSVVVRSLASNQRYFWRVRELTSKGPWTTRSDFTISASLVEESNESEPFFLLREDGKTLLLEFNAPQQHEISIRLVDQRGATLREILESRNSRVSRIDLQGIGIGAYFIVVECGDRAVTRRMILGH